MIFSRRRRGVDDLDYDFEQSNDNSSIATGNWLKLSCNKIKFLPLPNIKCDFLFFFTSVFSHSSLFILTPYNKQILWLTCISADDYESDHHQAATTVGVATVVAITALLSFLVVRWFYILLNDNNKLKFKNTTIKINLYSAVFNLVIPETFRIKYRTGIMIYGKHTV